MTILDFSKAFDTVPHKKLLHKLKVWNHGTTACLAGIFLTHRSLCIVLEGACSELTAADLQVPQGTILLPQQ